MAWRAEVAGRLRELLRESSREPAAQVVVRRGGRGAADGALRELRELSLDGPSAAGGSCRLRAEGAPVAEASLGALVLWLAASAPAPQTRPAMLAEARRVLRPGGVLIVVDHNRPRTWWRRLRNAMWCALHGIDPVRRPAYPVAREVLAAGFADVALRLACAERIQIVRARRAEASAC